MIASGIPEELKAMKRWVCVRSDSKVPLQPNGRAASASNPQTWHTFEEVEATGTDVGFAFGGSGIVGIDIDAGYDEDGLISHLACDLIAKCRSYTEQSRSGRGFHILVRGTIPFKGRNNRAGVEMYADGRYFILTGDVLIFRDIETRQQELDEIVAAYFPEALRESGKARSPRIYSPIWTKPQGTLVPMRPIYPRIPEGCRNISLMSLGGMLHSQGYSPKMIYNELLYANDSACHPPLPASEVRQIVKSVTRYKR